MRAEINPGYDKKRVILGEVIPLKTPFTIFINPSTICNFKCKYCTHGKSKEELDKIGFIQKNMDYDLFLQATEQLMALPDRFKLLYLYGNGEPLCNPKLPEMVEHISKSKLSEKIEFFTNGILLSYEKSLALIDAGLTKIKISIQGLTNKKYREITGVSCDFANLVDQIRYFYDHRKNCRIYIKIMDIDLSVADRENFYKTFGDICDEIFIEHMTFTQRTMNNYDGVMKENVDLYGKPVIESDVCAFPFYVIRIGVDGELNPCFENIFNKNVNIKNMSVYNYWNSDLLKNFRLMHLRKKRHRHSLCNGCKCLTSTIKPQDRIDDYAEQIIKRMEGK